MHYMKSIKNLPLVLILIMILGIAFSSCKKNNGDDPDAVQFTALFAEADTLFIADTTTITAVATGAELSYIWSASNGDIDGYGSIVKYLAPPCQPGDFVISCTVKDKSNNKKTKSISIHVKLF